MATTHIIPWYREQDWPEWCSSCGFTGSHEEWLARAEAGAKQVEAQGHSIAKVVIKSADFLDWAKQRSGKPDHTARIAYATSVFDAREHPAG
jgi:hypothetical protein